MIHRHLELIRKETAGQILYYFLEESGLLQNMLDPKSKDVEKKSANISKLFDKLKTYEVDHSEENIFTIVDWINLSMEIGESPQASDNDWTEINAVNILTVHGAKGLEFSVVFLVNLVAQRFPTSQRHEQVPIPDELIKEILPMGDYHLEEERRLFYVGMTRAKDKLFLAAANYYGEGKREKKLSPFISEALGNLPQSGNKKQDNKKSLLDYSNSVTISETNHAKDLKIDYLSYSQIETFKTCPMHYKLKYILKLPTSPSASQSFGISIHNTLKDFYYGVLGGSKPNEKYLFKLLKENWIKEGFNAKAHEEEFKEKPKKFLKEYLEKEFDPKSLPILMEVPFLVPIAKNLKIGGKIDRVDDLKNGEIEIWDYKTGANVPTQKDVDHDLQLSIYALAATTLEEKPFGKKPDKVKLTLYYFDGQKKITTTRTIEDFEKAKKEILKVRDEIEKSDFQCSGGFLCQNCEYKLLCEADD